jgi:NitT/TauT family transport system substrate-binding protein
MFAVTKSALWYVLVTLGIVVMVVPVLSVSAGPQLTTLRVAFRPLQTWGALFIAEKEGFFANQGLRIEWVPDNGGAEGLAPLIGGQLQVLPTAASAGFFNAVAHGELVRIVADKGYIEPGSRLFSSLVVRKDLAGTVIKTVADLKGKRIGINTVGSSAHYLLARVLAQAGLKVEDVDLHRLPTAAEVAGLQNRALDAAMIPEPWVTQLLDQGIVVLMVKSGDIAPNEQVAFVFYGPDLLKRDRALGRRFILAYRQALRQYAQGPTARNVAIVAEYTDVTPDLIRRGGWQGMFVDGHIEVDRLRRFQDWLYDIGMITVRNPIQGVVDTSFLEYATSVLK